MSCVSFAHRDADYFAPKLRERFPVLRVLTAMDLPEADDRLAEADVIVAAGHLFNDRRLGMAGKLKWIHAMTTGFDAIVGSRTLRPDVLLTTTRGIHGPQTSEMVIMYMMNLARRTARMVKFGKLVKEAGLQGQGGGKKRSKHAYLSTFHHG
jgi:phosphoglycerate dehydrogenase-like enzyme